MAAAKSDWLNDDSSKSAVPGEQVWAELMAGNRRFVAGKPALRDLPALRQKYLNTQEPKAVVLTCYDSRVAPELLFDQSLGDLFVIRNAGNVVDPVVTGSIEFAVDEIGTPLVVVMGHLNCAAATIACTRLSSPSPHIDAILQKFRPAMERARERAHGDGLIPATIEENVRQSAHDLLSASEILRHNLRQGRFSIVEAVYHPESGEVARIQASR